MVSDSDLITRLREILQASDLNTTSAGAVRRQLQEDFGVDLSDRKKFISQQIDEILQADEINGAEDDNVTPPTEEDDAENDAGAAADEEIGVEEEEESDDERLKEEKTKKKRKGSGFTRLCSLSPQLQELVGVPEMARTEVVKKLWAYIKEKDLQDPKNRRNIKCDQMLHSIFRVDTINMFQMNKSLTKHIWPLESGEDCSTDAPAPAKKQKDCSTDSPAPAKKQKGQKDEDRSTDAPAPAKKQKRRKDEDTEKSNENTKQKKGNATGFLKPLQLSDAFAKFLGTGETTIVRSDAVKRIWDYIKQNQLQVWCCLPELDPSDKRRILCDEKLKELFDVDTFNGFTVSKLLSAHLTKIEC
ncbi:upstream activation factor subunit spp27 isoform X3 [Beta vulgaris subsp. vulgaris]|uniref:upstream activation factor subunit spp27 isoform X3 n=1 Tax=Beta vulgaris subsp. vulgaris TaxID=3555 RepID=UPI0020366EA9|nr:upstream activation factor subunit spp27 isoform X3 [Beta vulgaris subsp. vulgaris]